ncbi:MAG: hypothetical protein OEW70_09000 [candidate division WOR-3 bacterium]|nr:hypothetical protein [candidate division WOR-3 bacterium]
MLFVLLIISKLSLLNLADSLYASRYFFDAATEYERLLYNFPSDSNSDYIRFKLGLSYLKANESGKGENIIRKIIETSTPYSRKAQLALAENFSRNYQFAQARIEIRDLIIFTDDSTENQQLNRILGWIELEENEFKKAEYHFSVAQDSAMVKETQSLNQLLRKDPFIAMLLSSIVPGSGEIYSGHYWTGIASFLVNAASIAGFVYSINQKNYLDAALIFSIFFNRFYLGSRQNAYDFAVEYNEKLYKEKIRNLKRPQALFLDP